MTYDAYRILSDKSCVINRTGYNRLNDILSIVYIIYEIMSLVMYSIS